jgi:DNA-binding transcriptional MerR regulator
MRVSEIARQLGISEAWLRRAEGEIIPKARRDVNNWRIYSEADLEILRQILFPPPIETSCEEPPQA